MSTADFISTISTGGNAKDIKAFSNLVDGVMNLKRDFNGAVGQETSKKARTSNDEGVVIDATSSNGRGGIGPINITTPVGYSQLNTPQNCVGFGSSDVISIGNKTSPPIRMRLGKQLGPSNSIDNFLSLFNQTGTISESFGGRFQVNSDTRGRIYHAFRHNLRDYSSENSNLGLTVNAAYPTGTNLLGTQGTISLATKSVLNAPIKDVVDGGIYFSNYNKADLEDVSWNLNKFKLGPTQTVTVDSGTNDDGAATVTMKAGTGDDNTWYRTKIALLNDVPVMQTGSHRALSAISQNNSRSSYYTSKTSYSSAPYRYDAVLNQGTVDYLFMNKGIGGLIVQVIVYRTKKNTTGIPARFSDFSIANQLELPIRLGNKKKYQEGFGTDDLGGEKRSSTDWITDPTLPYLPTCHQIEQSQLAYKEVERVKITMTSGERRPFQLKLGGEKYDPVNTPGWRKQDVNTSPGGEPCLFDEHSYVVALVVNGVPMSNEFTNGSNHSIVGDTYCNADFQYTGVYTESVGAMAYKKCNSKSMFTNGFGGTMYNAVATYNDSAQNADKVSSQAIVLTSQANAIRSPGPYTHGGQSHIPTS